jgi:hypothetical protein
MKKIVFLVFLGILGTSGLVWGASSDSYFPMKDGMTWEYQYKVLDLKSKKPIGTGKAAKKNLAPMQLHGTNVIPQVFSFY